MIHRTNFLRTFGVAASAALIVALGASLTLFPTTAHAIPMAPSDFNWTQVATSGGPPPFRCFGATTVYDPLGDKLILFAGNNCSGGLLNDTWVLSNASGVGGSPTWAAGPAGPMAPRANPTAVYDAANDRMIIFGGCAGGCLPTLNDTWVLVNATGVGGAPAWMNLGATNPPQPRNNHRAAYDPNSNRMILWGGQDGGGCVCTTFLDVWVLSNANGLGGAAAWTQLAPAGGPPPGGYISSASYDPATNTLMVFAGMTPGGAQTNAVWVLSNANGTGGAPVWTNTVAEGMPGSPSVRTPAGSVYDAANNRLMNFGSAALDTWVLANANGTGGPSTWSQLVTAGDPPAGTGVLSLTYDPDSNQMLAFVANPSNTANQVWRLSNANGIVPPPPPTTLRVAAKGRFQKTPINIKQKGLMPVTIFGSGSIPVSDIDQSSVRVGALGTELAPVGLGQTVNVDKDGVLDLVLQFQKSPTATPCGTTVLKVTGTRISNGQQFTGQDVIKVVPCAPPAT